MAFANEVKTSLTADADLTEKSPAIVTADPLQINVACLSAGDPACSITANTQGSQTVLHIYFESESGHKVVAPTLSLPQERRFGPKPKELKARRVAKAVAKQRRKDAQMIPLSVTIFGSGALSDTTEPAVAAMDSYFLHAPYLSFHLPPSVLYIGNTTFAPSKPVALVHTSCFWRSYKIQLGASLSLPGVIDPRGVVSWRHNGGPKKALQQNDIDGGGKLLKGYKVRGWRLWGETGKKYVHSIRDKRKAGANLDDPDVDGNFNNAEKAAAEEVVYLTWTHPLSRHTRVYTFCFQGVEFQWKGTGTVSEGRKCGWMLRFCHLKLIAKVPFGVQDDQNEKEEVCLGKYTCSIAAEKSGMLQVFDYAVLNFVERWMPSLLDKEATSANEEVVHSELGNEGKIVSLKQSMLYQLIIATLLCMIRAEKEKRHTIIDLFIGIIENAGNGGG